jgi:hypothetical protein
MTSNPALGRARLAILAGAFVVAACGGPTGTPTAAPVTTAPQTLAPTASPVVTAAPTTAATTAPTGGAGIDPSDDLEIGAPYAIEPMEPELAGMFITAMEQSLGELSPLLQVGAKSAALDGDTVAWIIVMRFPDLPMSEKALLDSAAEGGAGTTGTIEEATILGRDVRIIESQGLFSVLAIVDGDMVMTIGSVKADCMNVMEALIEAND